MKLTLTLKNQNNLTLQLRQGNLVIDQEDLTISQYLDTLLITAIDKILLRNSIDRLSLKSLDIRGKIKPETVSGMIIKVLKAGIGV